MGTSNFYNKNASRIFAITGTEKDYDPETEQELDNDVHWEHWQWEEFKKNCFDFFKENETKEISYNPNFTGYDNERNFSGTKLGQYYMTKDIGENPIEVNVNIYLRSGYYEGANFDYEISGYINNADFDYLPEQSEIIYHIEAANEGLKTIQSKQIENWINKALEKIIDHTEQQFAELCDMELRVTARFSNGETWYEKIT